MKQSMLTSRALLGFSLLAATPVFAQRSTDEPRETLPPTAKGVVAEDLDEANARFRKAAIEAFRAAAGDAYVLPDTSTNRPGQATGQSPDKSTERPGQQPGSQQQPGMQDKDSDKATGRGASASTGGSDLNTEEILVSSFTDCIVAGAPMRREAMNPPPPSANPRPDPARPDGSRTDGQTGTGDTQRTPEPQPEPQKGEMPREGKVVDRAREIGAVLISRPGSSMGAGKSKPAGGSSHQIGPVASGFYKVRLSDGEQSAELLAADGTVALRVPLPRPGVLFDPKLGSDNVDKKGTTTPAQEREREDPTTMGHGVNVQWSQVYTEILAALQWGPGRT